MCYTKGMLHDLTISVDDTLYAALQPMVEQRTIGALLMEFVHSRRSDGEQEKNAGHRIDQFFGALPRLDTSNIREEHDWPQSAARPVPSIAALRGTLHRVDTSDIREEEDREI